MKADEKLEALLIERHGKVRAALKAVREKRKLTAQRDAERHALIVGHALLAAAENSPDFELMLKGVLRTTSLRDSDLKFLQMRNWL